MSVLGIDIGLRNLSLCILSKTQKVYNISLWDNYNLLDETLGTCTTVLKNGAACKSKVCQYNVTFCKRHAPPGHKVVPVKLVKDYLLQDIAKKVLEKVESVVSENRDSFAKVTRVYIENQPRVNNKMRMVSVLVFGKLVELLPRAQVRFISANRKLKIGELVGFTGEVPSLLKGAKGYANRKKLSVMYTLAFLENKDVADKDSWKTHFTGHSKLNDLADSLGFCIQQLGGELPLAPNRKK